MFYYNYYFPFNNRSSIQVTDENDDPVTCQVIQQDSPFYVVSAVTLILKYHNLLIMIFPVFIERAFGFNRQSYARLFASNHEARERYKFHQVIISKFDIDEFII